MVTIVVLISSIELVGWLVAAILVMFRLMTGIYDEVMDFHRVLRARYASRLLPLPVVAVNFSFLFLLWAS